MDYDIDEVKEQIFYETNKIRKKQWKYKLKWRKFYNWEYTRNTSKLYDKKVIDDMKKAVENLLYFN